MIGGNISTRIRRPRLVPIALVAAALAAVMSLGPRAGAVESLAPVIDAAQPKIVKLYGAGGVRGLEAYQSGFLISATGHVLTAWSYVLDTDYITATLSDGRRLEAKLVSFDPRLEVAVLKIEAAELPYFDLAAGVPAEAGTRVLALSNLFGVATGDEAASVQHGVIAVKTRLDARRGTFETPYHGEVYVLDAMTNNPGAAGGAVINQNGELLGMLGKELRSATNNIWLNYAVPIDVLRPSVEAILAGKAPGAAESTPENKPDNPANLAALGIVLVPDVLERTPPFVDAVRGGSAAEAAGIKPDDLVVYVGDSLIQSCKSLDEEIARNERDAELRMVVMRGQELVEIVLKPVAMETEPE
ncbi:MAG: S1C family serine protease [Pirellulales bacterium]